MVKNDKDQWRNDEEERHKSLFKGGLIQSSYGIKDQLPTQAPEISAKPDRTCSSSCMSS